MNKTIKLKPKTIVLFLSALITTINCKSYAADLSPYQKLFEYLFTKIEIPTKSIKAWISGTEYTGEIKVSGCQFTCTIIEPHDGPRSYKVTEIIRTANTDSRGMLFYNTTTTKNTYSKDGGKIQFEESKSADSFPLYIEKYNYECQSSKNNSVEIKSSTSCTAVMTAAGPSLKSTELPSYKFDLQAAVKTVPKGCISDKEYTEWMENPAYLKTQTINLTSIINAPLTISTKFTPDLNQEMATEVSYRWTKIK